MKTGTVATCVAAAATIALVAVDARQMHAKLNYHRYLQEREEIKVAVEEYLQSDAYKFAVSQGIWTAPTAETRSSEVDEDLMQRFHMAVEVVEEMTQLNPAAEFSTDSPFTLLTDEEFAKYVAPAGDESAAVMDELPTITDVTLRERVSSGDTCKFEVDWKEDGCVTPVKNQGSCGSCWAFAAIAAVESAKCVRGDALESFSEQQLIACDGNNKGCNGGSPTKAMDFIQTTGLCAEEAAPYMGIANDTCPTCAASPVRITELKKLEQKDTALANAVRVQPVIVQVAAGNAAWKQYRSGIVTTCETTELDHAVLVYGFTAEAFLIKNSWSTVWGDNGYMQLARGGEGMGVCNIYEKMMYPELATE